MQICGLLCHFKKWIERGHYHQILCPYHNQQEQEWPLIYLHLSLLRPLALGYRCFYLVGVGAEVKMQKAAIAAVLPKGTLAKI